ncbi:hypothetical protein HY416_04080 [Candidatus Kaiserbacteria bacterium]|nr:hypothetical protein [Candidatus Kaiserbacteria bacterium]
MKSAYAQAGVDVDIEAQASRIMYEAARTTFENRRGNIGEIITPFDDFSGIRVVDVGGLPSGSMMCMCFDTTGTKVELAHRMNKHDTIAYDLFAMVCDDAVLRGGEPVLIGSNLDIQSLGTDERFIPVIRQLAEGYTAAAKTANVAVINGEIAQMGELVAGHGDFPYHWGAALVWFGRREKLFTGREIKTGDAVVMLRQVGFRANGLSLVRRIFGNAYGEDWHHTMFEDMPLGLHVLEPSTIYSALVVALHGGFKTKGSAEIHGVVHITGGGIPEKFSRVLRPSGLGVRLASLFSPSSVVLHCQRLGGISDRDAYGAWGMGQGMALITPEPEKVVAAAPSFGIEAQIAGEIMPEAGVIVVSQGAEQPGTEIVFDA